MRTHTQHTFSRAVLTSPSSHLISISFSFQFQPRAVKKHVVTLSFFGGLSVSSPTSSTHRISPATAAVLRRLAFTCDVYIVARLSAAAAADDVVRARDPMHDVNKKDGVGDAEERTIVAALDVRSATSCDAISCCAFYVVQRHVA
jgi:hypothetical protein